MRERKGGEGKGIERRMEKEMMERKEWLAGKEGEGKEAKGEWKRK